MAEIARLNGVIRALEQGEPAFVTFSPAEIGTAQASMPRPMTVWYSKWSIGPMIFVSCETACNSCWIGGRYCAPGAWHPR